MPTDEGQPGFELDTMVISVMREAIIDYIATTPYNINYNMLREMLQALINKESHPYFEYYADKMGLLRKKDDDGIPGPGGMATEIGANTGD